MKKNFSKALSVGVAVAGLFAMGVSQVAMAGCGDVSASALTNAVAAATTLDDDGGFPLNFWITVVDETGKVCAVTTNGTPGATAGNTEWLGSRVISAQKANTANAFSLDNYAISTANLYSAVQPGGSLYGLQHSNPVDASRAYLGNAATYGMVNDALKGKRIGGVNVFGGGLALYKAGKKVGAIGVSGDTSCADHIFAWNVRDALIMQPTDGQASALSAAAGAGKAVGITTVNFDPDGTFYSAAGTGTLPGAVQGDEMIITDDLATPVAYWSAWSHAACPNTAGSLGVIINN